MKAYHISKAGSPADLPDWLFDERERGITSRLREDDSLKSVEEKPVPASQPQPSRARDVPVMPIANYGATRSRPGTPQPQVPLSRAAQRLKEMTEAKRNPRVKFAESVHPRYAQPSTTSSTPAVSGQTVPNTETPERRVRPLPKIDLAGRQPRGLPSGVRPLRT